MPDNTTNLNFETLDLRFRAVPSKRSAWLPGGTVTWFILGLLLGSAIWIVGRRELANRLHSQVNTSSPSASLLAMEALESLDPNRIDHLVHGLAHQDLRVAKVACQKLNQHIDAWDSVDIAERFAAMRSLVSKLVSINATLPESNLNLARSLAARLYAMTIALDDPQLRPIADACQRLLVAHQSTAESTAERFPSDQATDEPSSSPRFALSAPPGPLPQNQTSFANLPPVTSQDEISRGGIDSVAEVHAKPTETIHRSSSNPTASLRLVTGSTRPRSTSTRVTLSDQGEAKQAENQSSELHSFSDQREIPPEASADGFDASQLDNLRIADLVKLLNQNNPELNKAVVLALRKHGLPDPLISLASELAVGTADRRMELLQQIATAGTIDPRPWLVWMAEDGQPEVKRLSISLVTPIADQDVRRSFQTLLLRETDPQIREMLTRSISGSSNPSSSPKSQLSQPRSR